MIVSLSVLVAVALSQCALVWAQPQQLISTTRRWSVSASLFGQYRPTDGSTVVDAVNHLLVAQTAQYHDHDNEVCGNETVVAVNTTTGTVLWQVYDGTDSLSAYRSGMTLSDHFVHFTSYSYPTTFLWALRRDDGTVAWKVKLPMFQGVGPYAAGSVVYVVSLGSLHAFDAATGSILQTTPLPDVGSGRPIAIGGLVLLPEETHVQAFTLGTNNTVYNASLSPMCNATNNLDAHLLASADRSVVWSWGIACGESTDRYLSNFEAATGAASAPPRRVPYANFIAASSSLAYFAASDTPAVYAARQDLSIAWIFNSSAFGDNYDVVYCQAASEDLIQQSGVLICFLPSIPDDIGHVVGPGILAGLDLNTGNLTWFCTIDLGDGDWASFEVQVHVVRRYNVYGVIIAAQPDFDTDGRIQRFDVAVTGLPTPPPTQAPVLPGIELMLFADSWQCDLQTNYTVARYESGCAASGVGGSILRFCSNAADGSQQLHEWVFAGSASCDNDPVGKTTVAVGQCQPSVLTNTSSMVISCQG